MEPELSIIGQALYLNLTYRCNSRCQFCAADVAYRENPRFLTIDEVQRLIGDGQYLDIFLSGGEPTIHPKIVSIVELCSGHSPCVTALTHGRSFHNKRFTERLLTAGLNYLIIPLYGCDAPTHDAVTEAAGSFEQTIQGLDHLQGLRSEHSFFVEIKLLLTRYTAGLNSRIYRMLRDQFPAAVNQISVCPLIYSQSTRDVLNRYGIPFTEMQENFYSLIEEMQSDRAFKIRLNEFPPCFFRNDKLRTFAHPQMEALPCRSTFWYGDDHTADRINMDSDDFVKTNKGNARIESCRQCRHDSYCSGLITSFFSSAYLEQYGETEFNPVP